MQTNSSENVFYPLDPFNRLLITVNNFFYEIGYHIRWHVFIKITQCRHAHNVKVKALAFNLSKYCDILQKTTIKMKTTYNAHVNFKFMVNYKLFKNSLAGAGTCILVNYWLYYISSCKL